MSNIFEFNDENPADAGDDNEYFKEMIEEILSRESG
jgi:hypothetical protein